MNAENNKVVQYLNEARASEHALIRVLQSQIAMTPRGSYRSGLEDHLAETRDHADRIGRRLQDLGFGDNPLNVAVGFLESVVGQAVALGMTPLQILRGTGGEEKVLKNAKDACATEALEIGTYTAIERLAGRIGDQETARLAASIREDEEKMLQRVLREIPKLTDAVIGAELDGETRYDLTETGAADAARSARDTAARRTRRAGASARRTARQARKVPGVAEAEGEIKGAVASEEDLAIPRYDELTADEILSRLPGLSQVDLAKVDAYERKNENRTTVLNRVSSLRGDEPWPGYDEASANDIVGALKDADDTRAAAVRSYERAHKDRASVIKATERELTNA